jgi:bifunctional non-homologous end joining protein LigD
MAATLTQERFTGPEWIFERKLDGIRLLAFRKVREVRLFSRNRLSQNCPTVEAAIARLDVQDLILDGELTWGRDGEVYHVFDILRLNGRDLTGLTLDERRAVLDSLVLFPPVQRVARLTDPEPWGVHAPRAGRV